MLGASPEPIVPSASSRREVFAPMAVHETYRHDCGVYVVVGQNHICADVERDGRGRLVAPKR